MLNYVTSLYPQALGSPDPKVDNRAFFERIYDPEPNPADQCPKLVLFDRVNLALQQADDKLARHVQSKMFDFNVVPFRKDFYSVKDLPSGGKELPINSSLEPYLSKYPSAYRQVGINWRDTCRLESALRGQAEAISHTMWMLSGLLGFIQRDGYVPSDKALFQQLTSSISIGLSDQVFSSACCANFMTLKRRQFVLANLPPSFPEPLKKAMLGAPSALGSTMFDESQVQNLVDVAKACSQMKSQQAMVDATYRSNRRSPRRSPSRGFDKRRTSQSPPRSPKRVRFDNSASSSSFKSPPPTTRKNFLA